jgi:hypothetical protein
MAKYVAPAALLLGLVVGLALVRADETPKYTTKQVMDLAHKDNKETGELALYSKLKKSTDPDEQKKIGAQLVELYTAMGQNKPPKGDADDWKKRSDAVVAAAKDVADGKDGGIDALKKANDCMGCHMAHRSFAR